MEYIRINELPPERAKKAYSDGYFAEAIQTIHGWIESQCQEMLMLVGTSHFNINMSDVWDITNQISLNNLVKVLFVLGQFTREELDSIQNLNAMRNRIIHQMFKEPYEKEFKGIPKKEYDMVFNKSLEFSELLQEKNHKLVFED